jgi:hypothetical protein
MGVLLAFCFFVAVVMRMLFFHELDLIMCFSTTSISSSPLILRIVFRWFVMTNILTKFCDSWANLYGTMHKLLIVEVRIDRTKMISSLSLTQIDLIIQKLRTSTGLFIS